MKKLLLIILLFLSTPVLAVKMTNLYQAEVPVTSQSDEDRADAIRKGLTIVLTKLTGNPEVVKNTDIKLALKRADYFVHDYNYGPPSPNSAIYMLRMNFEPRDIDWLLKKADVGYWGVSRPLIMTWIAVIRPKQGTEVIGDDNPSSWFRAMRMQANNLGIPMIFPLMDMADISQLSSEDVTSFDLSALKVVGKRYAPDGYLVGVISIGDGEFQSRWVLEVDNKRWDSTIDAKNIDEVTERILSQVSQTLAKQYDGITNVNNPIWLKLQVSKITDQEKLTALVKYLKQINVVQQVQLAQTTNDVVRLSVLVTSTMNTFNSKAIKGQRLSLRSQDGNENLLVYEWIQ